MWKRFYNRSKVCWCTACACLSCLPRVNLLTSSNDEMRRGNKWFNRNRWYTQTYLCTLVTRFLEGILYKYFLNILYKILNVLRGLFKHFLRFSYENLIIHTELWNIIINRTSRKTKFFRFSEHKCSYPAFELYENQLNVSPKFVQRNFKGNHKVNF